MTDVHESRPDSIGAGAPESDLDAIDVTQEMLDAGIKALALWSRDDSDVWKVDHVYRAMENVRRMMSMANPRMSSGGHDDRSDKKIAEDRGQSNDSR